MRLRCALLFLLASCRLNFEHVADGDAAIGTGGGDAGADADEVPAEPCNGLDDDQDGSVDTGCPCAPVDVLWDTAASLGRPGLVWTGREYLALVRTGTSYGVLAVRDGILGQPIPFVARTNTAFSVGDSFAWSGAKLGIAYVASGQPMLAIYNPQDGSITPTTVSAVTTATRPRVVWAGDRFGFAWLDNGRAHLRELDGDGVPLAAEAVLDVAVTELDALAAVPGGYVLGAHAGTAAALLALAPAFTAQPIALDIGTGMYMTIAASSSGLAVAWGTGTGARLFQVLAHDGTPRSAALDVPDGPNGPIEQFIVTPLASGFRLVGTNIQGQHAVVRVDYDDTGNLQVGPTQLTTFDAGSWYSLGAITADQRIAMAIPFEVATSTFALQVTVRCE